MENITLAVIGGSGLYSIPDLSVTKEYHLETPFGKPSAPVVVGTLDGKRIAFLARHGIGHHIANIFTPGRRFFCHTGNNI